MKVYIVFKEDILHMCYEITVFDSVFATKEQAESKVIELTKDGEDAWLEEYAI